MPDLINFSTMQANESAANCLICGDKATGKHYGVTSCDGCKGFFRRTIRKRTHYVCRFDKTCVVDKAQRNTCRRCRFDECIRRGMRKEAVQQERDRIAARSSSSRASAESSTETSPPATNALLDVLLAAEAATRQLRSSVITRTADAAKRMATTGDVTDSMHQQLILMVEWAKQLPEFQRLPMDAQVKELQEEGMNVEVALLRHFSAQHLVMCAAFRSTHVKDAVWLTNETCLHKDSPKVPDVNRVAARIVDHLTNPMRLLQMNETEYVALKAVAFFDPRAEGSSGEIEDTRQKVLSAFEEHVTRLSPLREMPRRLCNLLLLLPPMLAISRDLVEDVQLAKLFGLANIDSLMQELMLPQDTEPHFPKLGDVKP